MFAILVCKLQRNGNHTLWIKIWLNVQSLCYTSWSVRHVVVRNAMYVACMQCLAQKKKSGQTFLPFCHKARVWQTGRETDRIARLRTKIQNIGRNTQLQGSAGASLNESSPSKRRKFSLNLLPTVYSSPCQPQSTFLVVNFNNVISVSPFT